MRILFDSKRTCFKTPFGTLTPGQVCTLHIHIPCTVKTAGVECVLCRENGSELDAVGLEFKEQRGAYDIWTGRISFFPRTIKSIFVRWMTSSTACSAV